jgi:hypothetical protein
VPFGVLRSFPLVIADVPITARERRIALDVITLLFTAITIGGHGRLLPWPVSTLSYRSFKSLCAWSTTLVS